MKHFSDTLLSPTSVSQCYWIVFFLFQPVTTPGASGDSFQACFRLKRKMSLTPKHSFKIKIQKPQKIKTTKKVMKGLEMEINNLASVR